MNEVSEEVVPTRVQINEVLARFTDVDTGLRLLREAGIRGIRGSRTLCPVVKYLQQELAYPRIQLGRRQLVVINVGDFTVPYAMSALVQRIDARFHPDLLEEGSY